MKISIFGLGYVGFTAACCIASEGHEVIGVDVSDAKIDDVNNCVAPFEEPGLQELMQSSFDEGRLSATNSVSDALSDADMAIVCVGTPTGIDYAHDMRYIADVSQQISNDVALSDSQNQLTVVFRSTMRPGSIRKLVSPIFKANIGENWSEKVALVYNPEFLREAQAINDYFNPPKVVIGTQDGKPNAAMDALNANINAQVFITDYEEAEFTKFVDNSWHAVKVAFANEFGRVCQKMGVSAQQVHEIFVSDTKLNISPYYTRPEVTFGFHGPSSQIYGIALPPAEFEHWSRVMASYYPATIRSWYMHTGRNVTTGFYEISGADLIRLGVQRCPLQAISM